MKTALLIGLLVTLCALPDRGNAFDLFDYPNGFNGKLKAAPVFSLNQQFAKSGTDRWASPDKFDHFLVSAMLSGGSVLSLRVTHNDQDRSFVSSVGSVIALGACKEIYDAYHPRRHRSSWRDLTADAIGAVFGALLARVL